MTVLSVPFRQLGAMAAAWRPFWLRGKTLGVLAVVGLVVMLLGMPEFTGAISALVGKMGDWMQGTMQAMATGK